VVEAARIQNISIKKTIPITPETTDINHMLLSQGQEEEDKERKKGISIQTVPEVVKEAINKEIEIIKITEERVIEIQTISNQVFRPMIILSLDGKPHMGEVQAEEEVEAMVVIGSIDLIKEMTTIDRETMTMTIEMTEMIEMINVMIMDLEMVVVEIIEIMIGEGEITKEVEEMIEIMTEVVAIGEEVAIEEEEGVEMIIADKIQDMIDSQIKMLAKANTPSESELVEEAREWMITIVGI